MAKDRPAPSIDEMLADLKRLGWKPWRKNRTMWQSPFGSLFRGPYRAWTVAKDWAKE